MRAAFALLADAEVHNAVRKVAWAMQQRYRPGTRHAVLPPHVSLKQPFRIADLLALEEYMAGLARSIAPFEITLTALQVQGTDEGILWADVEETATLRQLHDRLNRELHERFGATEALFDGPDYHFHLTVIMGGRPADVYRQFLREYGDPRLGLRFTARELAMFVYDEPILPLGRRQP
jgi:2'-5' RNA ligase